MRITEALQTTPDPVFSFEFFPPKTEEGVEQLFATVEALRPLEPDYVSVTYGAGGGRGTEPSRSPPGSSANTGSRRWPT